MVFLISISGPILHFPVVEAPVVLHDLKVGRGTSTAMITAAVSQAVRLAMEKAQPVLMEPLMALEVGMLLFVVLL